MQNKITRTEQRVLDGIETWLGTHDYSPTIRELRDELEYKSEGSVYLHLWKLRSKGCVTWEDGKARTLRSARNGG